MGLERTLIEGLLLFVSREEINAFLRDPQHTATILGALIAISAAVLGCFLLLRGMALTSDAISHTVLLGIVVAFMVLTALTGRAPDLSSPWLIVGAASAGVATVVLTEAIYRSGLVKQDAALGLAFPLLFAIAVILVSRYVQDVHLDEDAVMVGEIGVAWADTNSHCLASCRTVVIAPGDPNAKVARQCTNCRALAISPRDERAVFAERCVNCGTYGPAQAWEAGLVDEKPTLVFWPKSITVMLLITLLTLAFVGLLFKELKLSTFDPALAAALGFRPAWLHYGLMVAVSLVAVGAFDAVGSILVIAFFIIPPATAYLLTDRLGLMLAGSAGIGALGAYFGYDLARGSVLGLLEIDALLRGLNRWFGLGLEERWNSSISASMVLMLFFLFLIAWILSPRYGLFTALLRRQRQGLHFDEQVVLGHIHHHEGHSDAAVELRVAGFRDHFRWSERKMARVMGRLREEGWVADDGERYSLTDGGAEAVRTFRREELAVELGAG